MWDWKRIAQVATLVGGGAVCFLVPGLGLTFMAGPMAAAGVGLALGINAKPVAPTKKKGT